MLTKKDLEQIGILVDKIVDKRLNKEIAPLKKDVTTIKSDISQIRKNINTIVDYFDNEYLDLRKRVE